MLTASTVVSGGGVNPVYHGAKMDSMTIAAGTYIRAGQVMGIVTGTGTAVNEVQTVTITGTPTGGTFTLWYGGIYVGNFAYNASVATIQAAFNTVFGAGAVVVGGGALPGTPVTLTFSGTEVSGTAHVAINASHAFTGGTAPAIAVTRSTPGKPAGGYAAAYNDALSDGTQVARRINRFDVYSNQFGQITYGQQDLSGFGGAMTRAVPMFMSGAFRCRDLVGLDAAAVADLGKLSNAAAYTESQAILIMTGW